jgi:tRNA(fMet)-specific endonuclease VapC
MTSGRSWKPLTQRGVVTGEALKYVVVDTDVFSLLLRRQDAGQYQEHLIGEIPVLSFASVAELYYGAAMAGWGERRRRDLAEMIRRYLIAPYNEDMAKLWGALKAQARQAGHALGADPQTNDLWTCATAIYHDAPLLTANRRHFENFPGLSLLQ